MIEVGGTNEERLYLNDLKFDCLNDIVIVKKTDISDIENTIARHKGRYHFIASFCRLGMKVLDFPCGSGYGAEILGLQKVIYHGVDNDEVTIKYAEYYYGKNGEFGVGNLKHPKLKIEEYNVIACIEGLEHIEKEYQSRLIKSFYDALIEEGILMITSPERGKQITNPFHKWELTRSEFEFLLKEQFKNVQILCFEDVNHRNEKYNFMYGICRKEGL